MNQTQITKSADWVITNFGEVSGIEGFAYSDESIRFIDGYIERNYAAIVSDEKSIDRFVSLFGSYLGECIARRFAGEWCDTPKGIAIMVRFGERLSYAFPFHKAYERIVHMQNDGLWTYYSEVLPQAFADAE